MFIELDNNPVCLPFDDYSIGIDTFVYLIIIIRMKNKVIKFMIVLEKKWKIQMLYMVFMF